MTALEKDFASASERLAAYRASIKQTSALLKQQYEQGMDAKTLVCQRAVIIDQILRSAWKQFMHTTPSPAFVAVGGYGRGELHPGSDIDLLIILPQNDDTPYRGELESFLTFLWDIGLDIGQSVRSLDECVEQALLDITIATNLMEARLICGPEELFRKMRERTSPPAVWPSIDFFTAKWQEQIARHHRYNDTAYNLEPNIKEGPGGLRDIQMIGWVAKRHFNAETLHDLVSHEFLTEDEYQQLITGQTFLWHIRLALHHLTGRREDRLLFDYQRELALQFGYKDGQQLAVEQFMKKYYRVVKGLGRLNEMLLQLFQEAILYANESSEPVAINKRFQARKGFIEVTKPDIFKRYPFALLEIFLLLEQHPELKGVRAETIRLIRAHRHLINDEFRNDIRCRSLFMEIMRQPQGITHELRHMNNYGILAEYLPAFGNIVGQMQYDLFHVYTVDEHTLFVVRNLRRFAVAEFAHEFPHCSELIKQIPKPEILYLGGLFHDIGKGRGGDHSSLGAKDAIDFCKHHMMSDYDSKIVAWLVEQHLVMSRVSQREDISDPDVVNRFAERVANKERLDYLYLLTVADMRATSPDVWNSWKGGLLRELYESTKKALRKQLVSVDDAEKVASVQEDVLANLSLPGIDHAAIREYWKDINDDYFLRYSVEEITWQMQTIMDKKRNTLPIVIARKHENNGATDIFVHAQSESSLFATITAVFDQLGLNIVDARIIHAKNNLSYDSYMVLDASGEALSYECDINNLVGALKVQLLEHGKAIPDVTRPAPRQLKHFNTPTEIRFEYDQRFDCTIMEVITADAPGLLARIGRALQECDVNLHNARISTFGARAEDLFYITNQHSKPLGDDDLIHLESAVREQITH